MKKHHIILATTLLTFFSVMSSASYPDTETPTHSHFGYLLALQGGANFPNWTGPAGNIIPLNNGVTGSLSFGYLSKNYHMQYALELNTMINNIALPAELRFANTTDDKGYQLYKTNGSGSLYTISLMFNVAYQMDFLSRHWVPYLGVGAGLFDPIISANVTCNDNACPENFNHFTYAAFGYQVITGLKYWFNDRQSIGLSYHLIGSNSTQNCTVTDGCQDGSYSDYHHQLNLSWQLLLKKKNRD